MSLVYCVISRGPVVLAEHSTTSFGNFITVSRVILERIPSTDARMSYTYDQYCFHYLVTCGITFLCMTEEKFSRRVAFAFLEDARDRFLSMFTQERLASAIAFQMNEEFSPVLEKRMFFFANDPSMDKLASIKRQIGETKEVMVENIEKILDRGEKIDILLEQTDTLSSQSYHFKKNTNKLEWAILLKNIKLLILVAIVLVIVSIMCVFMLCGPGLCGLV